MMMMRLGKKTLKMKFSGRTGQGKYVTSYDRLDLGVPVEVGHLVGGQVSLSVVPGGLYRVKVWSINGQQISSKPKEAIYSQQYQQGEKSSRSLCVNLPNHIFVE